MLKNPVKLADSRRLLRYERFFVKTLADKGYLPAVQQDQGETLATLLYRIAPLEG